MDRMAVRTDVARVDPATGRYTGNRSTRKINRTSRTCIATSTTRPGVISDQAFRDKQTICAALREFGYTLPVEQREALVRYCDQFVG